MSTADTRNDTWSVTVTSEEHSMVKIDGELPYAALLKHRASALATLGQNILVDGFRKGHVPEKVLLDRIGGEMALLTEMAERALARAYPDIIREHKIDAIGHPQISVTKLAPQNPLGFSALVAVIPVVTLPDYKTIARGIRRETAHATNHESPPSCEQPDEVTAQKSFEATARHRAALTDAIIEQSQIDIPRILIDSELGQMFGQMEHDLARANLKVEDYLGHIKKTRGELAKEWMPAAEKRAKLQLILNEIAKHEHIVASAETVEQEVAHLLEQYKDADQTRIMLYVSSMLVNEEVLKMLEKESGM